MNGDEPGESRLIAIIDFARRKTLEDAAVMLERYALYPADDIERDRKLIRYCAEMVRNLIELDD